MSTLVQDTLRLWRDAERLLEALPADSRERQTVAGAARELRSSYGRLTAPGVRTEAEVELAEALLGSASEVLQGVRPLSLEPDAAG